MKFRQITQENSSIQIQQLKTSFFASQRINLLIHSIHNLCFKGLWKSDKKYNRQKYIRCTYVTIYFMIFFKERKLLRTFDKMMTDLKVTQGHFYVQFIPLVDIIGIKTTMNPILRMWVKFRVGLICIVHTKTLLTVSTYDKFNRKKNLSCRQGRYWQIAKYIFSAAWNGIKMSDNVVIQFLTFKCD